MIQEIYMDDFKKKYTHQKEGWHRWTSKILENNPDSLKKIENIYRNQGVKAVRN
ncbi:hypothetical protein Q5M85_16910 [Paraclostridium bifermentans]|nr:hypothetical protein [Paraclostridium bifermentans]